jgi:hypothetical protein
MQVVNLFAGPGTGKSTTASALFAYMKRRYYNVELVSEYAKDLVWEERHKMFGEQDYIFAQQNKRLRRLIGKVDIAITDSPILLGSIYTPDNYYLPSLKKVIFEGFDSYYNINYFLNRKKKYIGIGRNQTAEEASEKDNDIQLLLNHCGIVYTTVDGDEMAESTIFADLEEKLNELNIRPIK